MSQRSIQYQKGNAAQQEADFHLRCLLTMALKANLEECYTKVEVKNDFDEASCDHSSRTLCFWLPLPLKVELTHSRHAGSVDSVLSHKGGDKFVQFIGCGKPELDCEGENLGPARDADWWFLLLQSALIKNLLLHLGLDDENGDIGMAMQDLKIECTVDTAMSANCGWQCSLPLVFKVWMVIASYNRCAFCAVGVLLSTTRQHG